MTEWDFIMHDQEYTELTYLPPRRIDYNTRIPNTRRADTAVPHMHPALKISQAEAARIDQEAKQRLLKGRKLSLVVDLDLTIIHASVDPTVGDWQNDPSNPNHNAVKEVRSFELYDDSLQRNLPYYIKPRPYLKQFLETISQLYELYVYTMGTRLYADNVVDIVDPGRKLFGDRVLSRTETPGEDSKNLRKLFPVDNRMVVIIDDRPDVWKYSNYLLRVKPFNFFVGIGDINASFLPKGDTTLEKPLTVSDAPDPRNDQVEGATVPEPKPKAPGDSSQVPTPPPSPDNPTSGDESALSQIVSMQADNTESNEKEKLAEQDENLAVQLNERPLLQLQKTLEDEQINEGHVLLKDDDDELLRVQDILVSTHKDFFDLYEQRRAQETPAAASRNAHDVKCIPDVKDILDPLLYKPLRGTKICFSRIIPLNMDIMKSKWADVAMKMGAEVQLDIQNDTTHLVTRPSDPTVKVRKAAARGIKIVRDDWLFDQSSCSWWQPLDETPYLIHADLSTSQSVRFAADEFHHASDDEGATDAPGLRISTGQASSNSAHDEPESPSGDVRDAGWDEAFDDEFDDLPEDSSSDEGEPSLSQGSTNSAASSRRGQKRKRGAADETDEDSGSTTTGNATPKTNGSAESALQKRKRQALSRTTSLTRVQQADDTDDTEGAATAEANEDDDDGDFDEAAFYAALREVDGEDEDDDDDGGGGGKD